MRARPALIGAACGAALELLGLGVHLGFAGWPLRPYPGCWTDPGAIIINAPARALALVVRVRALAPQGAGKVDAATVEAAEAQWSPLGFAALGLVFYASLGALAGFALRARTSRGEGA